MDHTGSVDAGQADRLLDAAMSGATAFRDGNFWALRGDHGLTVGRKLETLARIVYAGQAHLTRLTRTRPTPVRRVWA